MRACCRTPPGRRQGAVQHRDGVAEAADEPRRRLRCQRDLRHQHDRAPAALEHPLDHLQVHLGLARAGDAVQQHLALAAVHGGHASVDRGPLRIGEGAGPGRRLRRRGDRCQRPPRRARRDHQGQRARQRRAVLLGDPRRQLEQRRRHASPAPRPPAAARRPDPRPLRRARARRPRRCARPAAPARGSRGRARAPSGTA